MLYKTRQQVIALSSSFCFVSIFVDVELICYFIYLSISLYIFFVLFLFVLMFSLGDLFIFMLRTKKKNNKNLTF